MSNPRILVVEDEALVAQDLVATLQQLGYPTFPPALDGGQALDRLATGSGVDLVLMDISLQSETDGIDVAATLTQSFGVPVVFLTAHIDEDVLARARATSPYGILHKPFDTHAVRSAIEVALARHRAEAAARESAARFGATLQSMADGVIATDLAGSVTFVNPTAATLTGWSQAEALGKPLAEVFHVSLPSGEAADPLPALAKTAGARALMLTTKSGDLLPIEDNTAPITDDAGSLEGLVVVFREQRPGSHKAPADATPEWAPLVGIVESIGDPLLAIDPDWTLTYANARAASYFQTSREKLIGKNFWSLVPPAVRETHHADFYGALLNREQRHFEIENPLRGTTFDTRAYPFSDGLLVLFRDVTAEKAAAEQNAKIEKLESLGLLARGFAHDFNNLLTVLLGNLSLAKMRTHEGSTARNEIDTAKEATVKAQSLVQQLLTFAKGGAPIKSAVSVARAVSDSLQHHEKRPGITYDTTGIKTDIPALHADPAQLGRLLTNLIRNAEQAMQDDPTGGSLTITATHENGESPESAGTIILTVTDTGHGIPEDNLSQVFEPYFTTRAAENASGLGLTVCESITRAHGGSIKITPGETTGTTLTVRLPAAAAEGSTIKLPTPAPEPQAPKKRVLVLEDERLIRDLAAAQLVHAGFRVDVSSEGTEAIEIFRQAHASESPFDLLIFDLTIPGGLGGAPALKQIREIDQDVQAIVSSGYSDDPVMANPEEYSFTAVLPKPYDPAQLIDLAEKLVKNK